MINSDTNIPKNNIVSDNRSKASDNTEESDKNDNCSSPSGKDLVLLASTIAIFLSNELTANELNILGNFIAAVGASILTIAAAEAD